MGKITQVKPATMSQRQKNFARAMGVLLLITTCFGGCVIPPAVEPAAPAPIPEPTDEERAEFLLGRTVRVLGIEGGSGSGFSWRRPGWIATAKHVAIEGALVVGPDQEVCPVHDRFDHPGADVSLLRVTCQHLPLLGTTAEARTGQWVMSSGYPLRATAGNISVGVVSADSVLVGVDPMIQVDAVLNPGGSGGPVVDRQGRVLGISTGIASVDGMWAGVGFVTPAYYLDELSNAVDSWKP